MSFKRSVLWAVRYDETKCVRCELLMREKHCSAMELCERFAVAKVQWGSRNKGWARNNDEGKD